MDLFNFNALTFFSFLLTLMRVSLVIFLLPFYGGDTIPALVKAALCIVLTLVIWPHVGFAGELMPSHPLEVAALIVGELILGLMLGLSVHFIFAGIQTGGEIMGFQMGFTMVSLADPISGAQVSITSHLLYMVALLIFLALDGHLILLRAVMDSFMLIPPGGVSIGGSSLKKMIDLSGGMFLLAVKIAAPVIVALLMAEMGLALMGRAAPQMNLLTLGFPLKIAIGFFFISIVFSILSIKMKDVVIELRPMLHMLMGLSR